MRAIFTSAAMIVILTLAVGVRDASLARAQAPSSESSPPPLGPPVIQDSLTCPGLVAPFTCSTGQASRDISDEGLVVRVRGRCRTTDQAASYGAILSDIVVPDGEIRIEARSIVGAERLSVRVGFRLQPSNDLVRGLLVQIDPSHDSISIVKQVPEGTVSLAGRSGVGGRIGSGEWTAISIRFEGPRVWLYLDDALVLSAVDDTYQTGTIGLLVARLGSPDEDFEVGVAFRNMRAAGLASGDPARLPRTVQAETVPPPPAIDQVIVEESLIQPTTIAGWACPTGLASVEHAGEGLLFKSRGRCRPEGASATVGDYVRGLSTLDGEFAVRFKVVDETTRTGLSLFTRLRDTSWLSVYLVPSVGYAGLDRRDGDDVKTLARRSDIYRLVRQRDWNKVAIRTRGPEVWVLLNDQPLLYSREGDLGIGGAGISITRSGNLDDDQEAAVVFADLKVSALEDDDPARWPSFRRP